MTGRYVSKGAVAAKRRRQVRTVNPGLIGKRTTVPRQKRQPARAARHRKSQAAAGLSAMLGALFVATGQVFWAVGAITSAGAGVVVAHLEYRRDLATVKRTGRPIDEPKAAARRDDLSDRPKPKPVDLDEIRKTPAARTRKSTAGKHGPPGHEATCTAKTKEACPYWRKANPGRASKTTTKRATTGGGRKK